MVFNPYIWKRETLFTKSKNSLEKWILEQDNNCYEFDVNVRYGKDIDMASIKRNWPFKKEIALVQERLKFFKKTDEFISMNKCPVCSVEREYAKEFSVICGMEYFQCENCSHVYAKIFPNSSIVEKYYKESVVKNEYYINPSEIKLRLREIYIPKIKWIVNVYKNTFGREPKSIIDIGAGSGHFLYGCQQNGLEVAGIEYSKKYKKWCKEHFGIELHRDRNDIGQKKYDIVCSFNVIEHVYKPNDFILDYKNLMNEKSLAVIETPKVNSFNSHLQSIYNDEPRGIIVPYEHNHLFTDSSLATLLFKNGLDIKNVWYFGQDMAELIMRICSELNAESSEILSKVYLKLQQAIDNSHASNLMLVSAVNSKNN